MPSGAKKRKAAKKKKEKETNTNPSTDNPQGEDELKSQDEKGSDGGEGGSPAYRDHDHHNQFNERSEEVEESGPSASVAKSLEEVPNVSKIDEAEGGKEGVLVIEWDMKSEESSENKDVSSVHIESAKKSDYGNGNGNSGGSNSNDETVTAKNSRDEPYNNSVTETVEFDEPVNSVKETVDSVAESSADSVKAVTAVSETKSGDTRNVLLQKSIGSQVGATDLAMKRNEDKIHPFPDVDVKTSSLEEPETREFDGKVSSSVSCSHIPESTNGAKHVKDSGTPECSENQPLVGSAPQMVHKTSWLTCCGLFEVLSGSNR